MGDQMILFSQQFASWFLGQLPLLFGTIVFLGYLLLKKKWYEAMAGFIKVYIGFRLLQAYKDSDFIHNRTYHVSTTDIFRKVVGRDLDE